MKNISLPLIIILTLFVALISPMQVIAESTLQQATDELKEAEAKQKQASENLKNAQSKLKKIQADKKKATKEIYALEDDIDSLEQQITNLDQKMIDLDQEINELDAQINTLNEQVELSNTELLSLENQSKQIEEDLQQSKLLLQEAIERIESRDSLMRDRLRYMYTNGSVTYLEVLLHSTSFTDFLERFNVVKTLINHDRTILEDNKNDYEAVTLQIVEVEQKLEQLVTLYDQQVVMKDKLTSAMDEQLVMKDQQLEAKDQQVAAKNTQIAAKKKLELLKQSKNNQIAILTKEEDILAVYTEEQEREMIAAAAIVAASRKSTVYYKGGYLAYPLPETYRVSSNYGLRTNPITGKKGTMHNGIDFAAPSGTSILAAESGIVITAGWINGYGYTVILDHGDGLWTLYAHARKGSIQVEVGQTVNRGDKISEVGTTGNSTGYHLHFEVRLNEKAVEPRDYLNL